MLGEFSTLLEEITRKEKFYPVFQGERNKEEVDLVRKSMIMFNGEFMMQFKEGLNLGYDLDVDSRVIQGLYPLSVEEFVVYILYTTLAYLPSSFTVFVREFVLEWFRRSPLAHAVDRVSSFLDSFGIF